MKSFFSLRVCEEVPPVFSRRVLRLNFFAFLTVEVTNFEFFLEHLICLVSHFSAMLGVSKVFRSSSLWMDLRVCTCARLLRRFAMPFFFRKVNLSPPPTRRPCWRYTPSILGPGFIAWMLLAPEIAPLFLIFSLDVHSFRRSLFILHLRFRRRLSFLGRG